MLRYLSADIICSEKWTVFESQARLRKTASYEEQIMLKDKYPSIISPQMEAIVLQIFFATHAVLKIGEYSRIFPSFSWGIFGHVTHLDQSRASEKIWSIINTDIYYFGIFIGSYLWTIWGKKLPGWRYLKHFVMFLHYRKRINSMLPNMRLFRSCHILVHRGHVPFGPIFRACAE